MRLRLLIAALIFSAILIFLEQLALSNFLYWHYVWFDTVMHFIGGLTIGTFVAAVLPRFQPFYYVVFVSLLAVGWEVFEFYFGNNAHARNFFFDTSVDVLMDAFGAITAYTLARTTIWRSI